MLLGTLRLEYIPSSGNVPRRLLQFYFLVVFVNGLFVVDREGSGRLADRTGADLDVGEVVLKKRADGVAAATFEIYFLQLGENC